MMKLRKKHILESTSHILVHWRYLANTSKQIYVGQTNSAAFGSWDVIFLSSLISILSLSLIPTIHLRFGWFQLCKGWATYFLRYLVLTNLINFFFSESIWCVGSSDLGDPPRFWELLSFYLVPDTTPTLKREKCQIVHITSKQEWMVCYIIWLIPSLTENIIRDVEIEAQYSINCFHCSHC